jgi:hypothetical protein
MLMDKMLPSDKHFVSYTCDVHRNRHKSLCALVVKIVYTQKNVQTEWYLDALQG